MTTRTGHVVTDAVIVSAVALQGVSFGISPSTTQAINSIVLLALAVIGAWTAAKTSQVKKIAEATHTLTNSAMGAQLLTNVQNLEALAVLAHRFAENNNESDIAAASAIDVRVAAAKALYQKHLINQATVDAKA